MSTINERFKKMRKECKKNQSEWGKILGLSTSGVSEIESGRRNVTEQHIIMLRNCNEFNVNEGWLRTGEGKMFIEMSPDNQLAYFMGKLLSNEEDTAKKKVFRAMSKLPDEWFLQFYNAIVEESNKNE